MVSRKTRHFTGHRPSRPWKLHHGTHQAIQTFSPKIAKNCNLGNLTAVQTTMGKYFGGCNFVIWCHHGHSYSQTGVPRDHNWRYYLQIQIPWGDNNTEAFLMKLSIGTDRWDGWQAAKRFKYARTLFRVTQLRLAQPSNSDQGENSFHGRGAGLSTYKVLG